MPQNKSATPKLRASGGISLLVTLLLFSSLITYSRISATLPTPEIPDNPPVDNGEPVEPQEPDQPEPPDENKQGELGITLLEDNTYSVTATDIKDDVVTVELYLKYDPALIEISNIEHRSEVFETDFSVDNNKADGILSYTMVDLDSSNTNPKSHILFEFTATKKKAGKATISFVDIDSARKTRYIDVELNEFEFAELKFVTL